MLTLIPSAESLLLGKGTASQIPLMRTQTTLGDFILPAVDTFTRGHFLLPMDHSCTVTRPPPVSGRAGEHVLAVRVI